MAELRWARLGGGSAAECWGAYYFSSTGSTGDGTVILAWVRREGRAHYLRGLGEPDSHIGILGRAHSLDDALADATSRLEQLR